MTIAFVQTVHTSQLWHVFEGTEGGRCKKIEVGRFKVDSGIFFSISLARPDVECRGSELLDWFILCYGHHAHPLATDSLVWMTILHVLRLVFEPWQCHIWKTHQIIPRRPRWWSSRRVVHHTTRVPWVFVKGKIWIKCMKRLSGGGFSSILEIHGKVEGSHYKHPRIWNNHWVSWEPLSKLIFTDIQANWCSLDSVVVNRSSVFWPRLSKAQKPWKVQMLVFLEDCLPIFPNKNTLRNTGGNSTQIGEVWSTGIDESPSWIRLKLLKGSIFGIALILMA